MKNNEAIINSKITKITCEMKHNIVLFSSTVNIFTVLVTEKLNINLIKSCGRITLRGLDKGKSSKKHNRKSTDNT